MTQLESWKYGYLSIHPPTCLEYDIKLRKFKLVSFVFIWPCKIVMVSTKRKFLLLTECSGLYFVRSINKSPSHLPRNLYNYSLRHLLSIIPRKFSRLHLIGKDNREAIECWKWKGKNTMSKKKSKIEILE